VATGHGTDRPTQSPLAVVSLASIAVKKTASTPLTRPQTNSVVERDARVASAGRGRSTTDAFCGPARDWPYLVWPKFQFSLKKEREKRGTYAASLLRSIRRTKIIK
jgi:hypothetical protein